MAESMEVDIPDHSTSNTCICHNKLWRSQFQCLYNAMRADSQIGGCCQHFMHHLPIFLCTREEGCPQKRKEEVKSYDNPYEEPYIKHVARVADNFWQNTVSDDDFQCAFQRMKTHCQEKMDKCKKPYGEINLFLTRAQRENLFQNGKHSSAFRLLYIIWQCIDHYSDMKRTLGKIEFRKPKSKKKDLNSFEFPLPDLRQQDMGNFIGMNGQHICRNVPSQCNVTVRYREDTNLVYATVKCPPKKLPRIQARLDQLAKETRQRRDEHEDRVRIYAENMGFMNTSSDSD